MNSTATASTHTSSSKYLPRTKVAGGLHLSPTQSVYHPADLKHEISVVPSTSVPTFGGYFVCDLKEKNIKLENLTLQFNVSPLVVRNKEDNSPVNGCSFVPAYAWITRLEVVMNNITLDTLYPTEQFILSNILYTDAQRLAIQNAAGHYASYGVRNARAMKTSDYIVQLHSLIDQIKPSILSQSDEIQLRIYMDSLPNVVDFSSTGISPNDVSIQANINFCNVLLRHTKLNQSGLAATELANRAKTPYHGIFHDRRYGLFNIPTLATEQQLVLSAIVGKVSFLFFTVRAKFANGKALQFCPIQSFQILDSNGQNIIGGSPLNRSQTAWLMQNYSKSSFLEENMFGYALSQTEIGDDNGINIYAFSFSDNPIEAMEHGRALSSHHFIGSEQLRLTLDPTNPAYSSGNGTTYDRVQVDVFAFCENVLQQSSTSVIKLSA